MGQTSAGRSSVEVKNRMNNYENENDKISKRERGNSYRCCVFHLGLAYTSDAQAVSSPVAVVEAVRGNADIVARDE